MRCLPTAQDGRLELSYGSATVALMVNPTWEERDLLVLRAAVEYCEEHDGYAEAYHLRGRLDMSERDIRKAFNALCAETPKLFGSYSDGGAGVHRVARPTGEARRRLGIWPTSENMADRLVHALALMAEQEPDEVKKSWLRKSADYLGATGREVLVDVVSSVVVKSAGIG